ncbi:MAG: hypothetical protein ACQEXB_05835 [Bacillota bacterium]
MLTLKSTVLLVSRSKGYVPCFIHGVTGADVVDATHEALDLMAKTLPGEGATSFLATTMTQGAAEIEKALDNVGNYKDRQQEPGKAGIDL